jgi:hypothetical protein
MGMFFTTFFPAWEHEGGRFIQVYEKETVLPGKLATLYIDGENKG